MVFPEVLTYALVPVPLVRHEGSPILAVQHMPHRLWTQQYVRSAESDGAILTACIYEASTAARHHSAFSYASAAHCLPAMLRSDRDAQATHRFILLTSQANMMSTLKAHLLRSLLWVAVIRRKVAAVPL